MANIDIVARLQLRAEQFSSETGARFAEMKTRARSAAQDVRESFNSSFAEVQKLAAGALKMPRTTGGSLDLTSEIASLTAASAAADQRAISLRELSIAQSAVAAAGRGNVEALRLEADASAVAALAAEHDAGAMRTRISVLNQVQTELSRTRSVTTGYTADTEAAAAANADYAARADKLLNSLDPVRAAQQRANAEISEALQLMNAGHISAEQYAQAQDHAAASLRQVADAAGVAAEKQRAFYAEQAGAARDQAGQDRSQTAFAKFATPGLANKSASDSAAVFEAEARSVAMLEERINSLRAAIDPLWAAQQRYNVAQAEARDLIARGAIGLDDYAKREVQLQEELLHTTNAIKQHTAAGEAGRASDGQRRAAMQQLGFQLNDVATSYSSGAKVSMIFAQQSGQVIQALQMMTNSTKGFLGWLGGPWGTVAAAATIVMVPLVAKMFEMNNAVDDATDKLKKEATQSDITRQAKERYKTTTEGVSQAIREQRDAQLKAIEAEKSAAEQANITAKTDLDRQLAIRRTTVALLERAEAEYKSSQSIMNPSGGTAQIVYGQQLTEAQAASKKAKADLAEAEVAVKQSRIDLAAEAAKRAADPLAQINKRYDDMANAAKKAALGNDQVTASLTRQLYGFEKRRQADIKAAQEANRKPRSVSLGDQLENEQASRLLSSAQTFRGASENTTSGRATLKGLFAEANVNVDPKMVAWCAAFVNSVLASNGLPGTGSLAARSFLGYGEATDKPTKGDIVVSKRGTGAQGHVGFYEGTDAKGNVRVLGGNTGDKVGTQTVKRADVLGFRRAPTAAESFSAEEKAAKKASEFADKAADDIARLNAQWGAQPRLIERANLETAKVDALISDLQEKKPPNWEKLVSDAQALKVAITDGMNRPFNDFVKSQQESLAVQQMALAGRDVEANAMQNALRLQQQQGDLTDAQLAKLVQIERAQKAIADALEDQQRIVGVYTGMVGNLQRTFDDFLKGLDGNTGSALKGLFSGIIGSVKDLQRNLISEKLFGGLDRTVAEYVRKRTGGTTPADMLKEQLGSAGTVLDKHVQDVGSAVDDFVAIFRKATASIGTPAALPASFTGASLGSEPSATTQTWPEGGDAEIRAILAGLPALSSDQADIVVTANPLAAAAAKVTDSAGVLGVVIDGFSANLRKMGIEVPRSVTDALKRGLPTVFEGVGFGQLGGSVFSSITGGKDNKLASSIGGVLGDVGGKAVGKVLSTAIGGGLGKALGSAAGPIGSVLGGIAGNLIGGLFKKTLQASSTLTFGAGGLSAGPATGSGAQEKAAASASANSVVSGINKIAEALGGTIGGAGSVSIGYRPGHKAGAYRVDTTGQGRLTGVNAFDTEEEAIRFALSDALKDGVVAGISDASKRILAAGGDLETAIEKASLIESIPKQLKARLDPVGAAVDDVTAKFDKIFAALKEGGATAAQTADAQKLYNLELADAKASVASASAGLKSFYDGLKMGSSSPLSLRDQEMAAKSALQPFLDQIGSGKAVDQDKYQAAAQTYLDIERQLNGSTSAFFAEFDKIQAATAKAIEAIDGVQPINGANDAAISSTASNTAATAAAAQATAEIGAQGNELLSQLVQQNAELLANIRIAADNGFIGEPRNFLRSAA